METEHFDCACSDFNHTVRFTLDPDDGDLYIDVRLNNWGHWYTRIWTAIRYIFKRHVAYGHYDVTILRDEDYDRMRDLLKRSEISKAGHIARIREQKREVA